MALAALREGADHAHDSNHPCSHDLSRRCTRDRGVLRRPGVRRRSGSGGHVLLRAELVGSMPAPGSPVVAGINPGGAPWVNGPSRVRVRDDGRITVQIRGLVLPPPRGTGVNPIASVVATLVCDQLIEASTMPFVLSAAGNGSTREVIAVPRHCDDPVV